MCFHSGNAKTGCQRRAMPRSCAAWLAFAAAECASTSAAAVPEVQAAAVMPCRVHAAAARHARMRMEPVARCLQAGWLQKTGSGADAVLVAGAHHAPADKLQALVYKGLQVPREGGQVRASMFRAMTPHQPGGQAAVGCTHEKAYERDAGNRVIAYHLADLLFKRRQAERARFPVCRLNNGGYANAKSLREGSRVERALDATSAMQQLARQRLRRFTDSTKWQRYEQGAFHG